MYEICGGEISTAKGKEEENSMTKLGAQIETGNEGGAARAVLPVTTEVQKHIKHALKEE